MAPPTLSLPILDCLDCACHAASSVHIVLSRPNIKVMRADGCVEYVGVTSGRNLKIVVDEQHDPALLVTAFGNREHDAMTVDLDTKPNAAYARVADRPVAVTKELDAQRLVDYDADGEIVGIEFLAVSRGVALHDLPYRDELSRFFDEHHIPVFA
jgi:uncharacterized protein YuzE